MVTEQTLLRNVRIEGQSDPTDLRIVEGRIDSIGAIEQAPSGSIGPPQVFDVEGRLALPGFVNAHAHLDKALLTQTATTELKYVDGYLEGGGLEEVKRSFTVENVKARARKVLDWAVATGTTAIRSHIDVDPNAGLTGVQAILELREEYASLVGIQTVAFPQDGFVRGDGTYELMEEALKMGVDVVGGKPSADPDFRVHLDSVFRLAVEYERDVDVHADTSLEGDYNKNRIRVGNRELPADLETVYMAQLTLETGLVGRVTASHLCALDTLVPELQDGVISLLREADVAVIVNPSSNLHWGGRQDTHNVRRGIAPVSKLLEAGVRVAYATDNFGDAWNLYSGPDMLAHGLLTAQTCHMRTTADLWTVMGMGTVAPAKIMGLPDHGLVEGRWADLVVLDADSLFEAMIRGVSRSVIFRRGRLTAMTHTSEVVFGP